jgi:hypothetical protein
VWQNGEFRNDAAIGIYLAPEFQWLANQQPSIYASFFNFSDCRRVRNPRWSTTQEDAVNYSSLD